MYYILGIGIGILSKIKKFFQGSIAPNPRKTNTDIQSSVRYTLEAVEEWEEAMKRITREDFSWEGKSVLEIGPGHDLGTGFVLFDRGVLDYTATDKFPSLSFTEQFYAELFKRLSPERQAEYQAIAQSIATSKENQTEVKNDTFRYHYFTSEEMSDHLQGGYDMIISKHVLEHIDDPFKSLQAMHALLKPGGIILHRIDFRAHISYIEEKDVLNMLRYSPWVYENLVKFQGGPNRYRVGAFQKAAEMSNFHHIITEPVMMLSEEELTNIRPQLAEPFRDMLQEDLRTLIAYIFAQK